MARRASSRAWGGAGGGALGGSGLGSSGKGIESILRGASGGGQIPGQMPAELMEFIRSQSGGGGQSAFRGGQIPPGSRMPAELTEFMRSQSGGSMGLGPSDLGPSDFEMQGTGHRTAASGGANRETRQRAFARPRRLGSLVDTSR